MPALQTVSIIGTHADNALPTLATKGATHQLSSPDNAETGAVSQVVIVDCHETVTIPIGNIVFISGYQHIDIPSTPSNGANSMISQTIVGSGSPIAISIGAVSPNTSVYTMTTSVWTGYITFIPTYALPYVLF